MEEKKITWSTLGRIVKNQKFLNSLIWPEKKWLMLGMAFLSVLVSIFPFLRSGAEALLINLLTTTKNISFYNQDLIFYAVLFLVASFIPAFIRSVDRYFEMIFWYYVDEKFKFLVAEKNSQLDIATHEDPKKKDLFLRVREDALFRVRQFSERQFRFIIDILQIVIALGVLTTSSWWLLFIVLLSTLPELLVESKYGRRTWATRADQSENWRIFWRYHNYLESLRHVVEMRIFQNVKYFLQVMKKTLFGLRVEEKRHEKDRLHDSFLSQVLSQGTLAAVYLYFIYQVVNGEILIGTFLFMLASLGTLRAGLSGLALNLARHYEDSLFMTDLVNFLTLENIIKSRRQSYKLSRKNPPMVRFDNVSFSYPETNRQIINNFTLEIKAGEKLALVGLNGAGKTTLIKLLCRFYDPSSGGIYINGHNLKEIELDSWYDQIGALFQDFGTYDMTAKDFISSGRISPSASMREVIAAAKKSGADDFIKKWPNKYEQMLGKEFTGGLEPSVGQWQKIALTRVFYRQPRLYILDEPTASIDAEAEAKIFEQLENLPDDITVILISHRFSTVRKADRVAVVADGELKELGTHEELLAQGGEYARLFKIQALGYE